jgi:Zn-dependent protease with chaperone function/DNA-directed RNA polymerase subunit M/transcription elongation factor TFIIS
MFCVHCGASLPQIARFCNRCGKPVSTDPAGRKCLGCGELIPHGQSACPQCGAGFIHCHQCGRLIMDKNYFCPDCKTLRGISLTYQIPSQEFEHPSMQQMNNVLRQSTSLTSTAQMISKKVGKPWYESLFNSILTSEKQYARVYELAYIAARRIGMKTMPSVYIEADRGYQTATYGSDQDSFVNIGTFLPRLLNDRELLFVLGHELGHLISNHALWTTVSMFLVGQHRSTVMSDGLISYFSNPLKIVEQGMESVISSWMRVADLTADRAALLVVGDFDIAKRVLFLLYFKSRRELQDINLDEWVRQQMTQDSGAQKLSEFGSPTPYLGSRLKELQSFYHSPQYEILRRKVESGSGIAMGDLFDEKGSFKKKDDGGKTAKNAESAAVKIPAAKGIPCKCPKCGTKLTVQVKKIPDSKIVKVTCPSCKNPFQLDLSRNAGTTPDSGAGKPDEALAGKKDRKPAAGHPGRTDPHPGPETREGEPKKVKTINGKCPKCGAAFSMPLDRLAAKSAVELQCNRCKNKFRLILPQAREDLSQTSPMEDDPA